jgi:hypothetical protein
MEVECIRRAGEVNAQAFGHPFAKIAGSGH